MNRRGFIPGMLAVLATPIAVLSGKNYELMDVYQWDWHGRWNKVLMKDLHIHDLFTMVAPDGEPCPNDGKIFQAMSEPYLVNESLEDMVNNPLWGIDGKEVQGDPRPVAS